MFFVSLKGYKSRNDTMKWTSLETKPFLMSAKAFEILSCFRYYISSQHHNYSSNFILSNLYVKINLRIFSLLFSWNSLQEHKHNFERREKGLDLSKTKKKTFLDGLPYLYQQCLQFCHQVLFQVFPQHALEATYHQTKQVWMTPL